MKRFTCLILLATAGTASADVSFSDQPGFVLHGGGMAGINSDDDATDFGGTHPIGTLEGGYRFHTGTGAFATFGLGFGGHEAIFPTFGLGVRQRVMVGPLEPFVQLGFFHVGDGEGLPLALGVGAGADVRLSERFFVGASADHYFSNDSDSTGGLDWGVRMYLGARLGGGYR